MPTDSQFHNQLGDTDQPTEVVVVDPGATDAVVVGEPVVVADDQDTVAASAVVAETQAAVVEPDGTVNYDP